MDDDGERDELVRRLFYLLTARMEDGAGIAAEGQGSGLISDDQRERVNKIKSISDEMQVLTDVALALLEPCAA